MPNRRNLAPFAVAISLGLALTACNEAPVNTSLYSTKQPVVERSNFTLDLTANATGLPIPERQRLQDWFESLGLKYGDRISLDGVAGNECGAGHARREGEREVEGSDAREYAVGA